MSFLRYTAAAAAIAMVTAPPVLAQGLSFSGGATLTSNYMGRGVTNSLDRGALQFYGEVEANGLFAGVWGSTVDFGPGNPDALELDIYAGYRWSLGATSIDLGYVRYIYDSSGNCCGELYATFSSEAGNTTFLGGIYYDPGARIIGDVNLGVSHDWGNSISTGLMVGRGDVGFGGWSYAVAEVGYSISDSVSLSAAYHFSNAPAERRDRFVVSASVGF
jgi:uncharacterized protein (TIGR02001 family)